MPGINSTKPDVEKSARTDMPRENMLELFDDIVEEKVFSFLHNEATLLEELRNNPTKIYAGIREEMRRKLINSPGWYENFTEEDISNTGKLSDKTIREKLEILLVHVKSGQDRLEKRVKSLFARETFVDTPDGNENRRRLNEWIPKQNAKDIEKYLKSSGLLRRKLWRECFWDDRIATFISRDSFITLAQLGISINDLTPQEKATVNAISSGTINSNSWHIQIYLKLIDRSSKSNSAKLDLKKDLLRTTFPTVSPKFLVENGVISEPIGIERVRLWLQSILWEDYFTTWNPEEKVEKQTYLRHVYTKSQHIELPIDDYLSNDAFVESIFTKWKLGETAFTRKLEETLIDMRTEITVAEFDLDGMDIRPDIDGNWHMSVINSLSKLHDWESPKIKNALGFEKWSYIRIVQDRNGEKKYSYMRVTDVDKEFPMPVEGMLDKDGLPVKHRGIRFEDWWVGDTDGMVTPWHESSHEIPYSKLWTTLKDPNTIVEILSENEVIKRRKTPEELAAAWEVLADWEERIKTIYSEDDTYDSLAKLSEALWWKPEKWSLYTSQDMVWGADFFLEVVDISEANKKITISDGKETHTISFYDFYNKLALPLKLKEQGKYQSTEDINTLIQWIDGFKNITVKDGVLMEIVKWDDGKDVELPVNHFMNEDGEGMYFSGISSDGVSAGFGVVKAGKDGNGWSDMKVKPNLRAFTGNKASLSIVGMLNLMRENDYKPYVNPKDKPEEADHEAHMPHGHGSFWGKIMNGTSASDMMKAFDLYKHAWEHKLEKNSKFQSAKFADKYLRKLMPEGFSYQLRSEAYGAQNEAMEGILKMLESEMSGKEARLYIRKKILLNDDAKFEEVLAGLLYISKKSGQLYPEELSDLKNSNLWFYKLAVTQWYNTKAARKWLREKCIASSDKWAADINAITEIDLVERQLKFYEGKGHRMPPNIAPKFPGAIREWEEESKKKGDTEVRQRSNMKQMNKYALSKAYVWEWYKVLGTGDKLHSKNGSAAELNAMPFLMVYSNAPEYMGSNFRQALHSQGTGKRASHAFKFGNEMSLVNTYRSVVQMAAIEVGRRTNNNKIVEELNAIEAKRKSIGNENHDKEPDEIQKKWITSIYNFWMRYGDKLQPILQMSDTYIDAEASFWSDDKSGICKAYKERYTMTSGMQNKQLLDSGEIYKTDNVTEWNMIADHTPFAFTNMVNASFSAIYPQSGVMGQTKSTAYPDIFKPWVLGALYKLRNLSERDIPPWMDLESVQRARFEEYFAALMYYIRLKWSNPPEYMIWWTKDGRTHSKMNYIKDLEKYGFDFKVADFWIDSSTKPAWAELDEKTQTPNDLVIDSNYDKARCEEMFQQFRRTSGHVMHSVSRNVWATFDTEWYWG
jgi:hypothetical protein